MDNYPEKSMNAKILQYIVCPICKRRFTKVEQNIWICEHDGYFVPISNGKPFFSTTPEDAHIYKKVERAPDKGTPWRQANWRFLEEQVGKLDKTALVLDVGSGRGDFSAVLADHLSFSLDIIPYDEVDIVCDLAVCVPFSNNTFDAVILMNVIEHVYEFQKLLVSLHKVLKPEGKLIMAVPLMIKIHQRPFDFYRYTHYTLQNLAKEYGFFVEKLDGYYDPVFFLGEGIKNVTFWYLPRLQKLNRIFVRLILGIMRALSWLIQIPVGKGYAQSPTEDSSPFIIGYHLILRKI